MKVAGSHGSYFKGMWFLHVWKHRKLDRKNDHGGHSPSWSDRLGGFEVSENIFNKYVSGSLNRWDW